MSKARAQGAFIGLLLHLRRLGGSLAQILKHLFGKMPVFGKEMIDRVAVERARGLILAEVRHVVTALLEVLITGGALLAVPTGLVDHNRRRQNGKPLDGECDM